MDTGSGSVDTLRAMGNWQNLIDLLGFGEPCKNKGKRVSGICKCLEHFYGKLCEYIKCENNGRPINNSTWCECPDPHIQGRFCQTIHCENGGTGTTEGACECPYGWYTGQYCQHYSTPWLIVLGVGIALLVILTMVCFVCRLDICQRCCRGTVDDSDDDEPGGRRRNRRWHGAHMRNSPDRQWHDANRRTSEIQPIRPSAPSEVLLHNTPSIKPPDYTPEQPPPPYEEVVNEDIDRNNAGQQFTENIYGRNGHTEL